MIELDLLTTHADRTGEFVVNLVDEPLAAVMNRTSATVPYGVSEMERPK